MYTGDSMQGKVDMTIHTWHCARGPSSLKRPNLHVPSPNSLETFLLPCIVWKFQRDLMCKSFLVTWDFVSLQGT